MESEKNTKKSLWPALDGCTEVMIEKFTKITDERDGVPSCAKYNVTDAEDIGNLFARMYELPTEGDMFKTFDDETEMIHVTFRYMSSEKLRPQDHLYVYNGRVQLPDTSFISFGSNSAEKQDQLVSCIKKFLE